MKHEILPNGDLKFTVGRAGQRMLKRLMREDPRKFSMDETMHDLFEHFICNSEFEWGDAETIGALTSAPILWTLGEERKLKKGEIADKGNRVSSSNGKFLFVQDVLQAWAFMDYQIISVQQRLAETGEAVFKKGYEHV